MTQEERKPRRAAPRGSLRLLWAEFTDPGPSGDALVFLKKYLEGIAPACMGLLFMSVGILVAVVLAGQPDSSGKKSVLPIVFGGFFALVGLAVAYFGVKTILEKSGKGQK